MNGFPKVYGLRERRCDMTKSIVAIVFLFILYITARIAARDIREEDAILGVNRKQWEAILIMWLCLLIALAQQGR